MTVTGAVPALTFCLTLLGAPTLCAGSPAGRVDALTLPKLSAQSCVQRTTCDDGTPVYLRRAELQCTICGQPLEPVARAPLDVTSQLCDALELAPLVPVPASCRTEPSQHAANETTSRL